MKLFFTHHRQSVTRELLPSLNADASTATAAAGV
jgi:hypothetical protein